MKRTILTLWLTAAIVLGAAPLATHATDRITPTVTPVANGSFEVAWPGSGRASIVTQTRATTTIGDATARLVDVASPATVAGLKPDYRWYFVIAPAHGGQSMLAATRQFVLQGAHNVRDMGGFVTRDGHVTAWGKVFRGDNLSKLAADDDRALTAADVTTVVSYLGAGEVARLGADKLPPTTHLVSLPDLDPFTQVLADTLETALRSGDRAKLEEMLGNGKARRLGDEGFVSQLDKPATMAAYGQTLRLIADNHGALLYHCSAGKDRTGIMSAFLLGVLGVPDAAIVKDFVASNDYNRAYNAKVYAYLKSKDIDVALVRPLMEQRASEIEPVLAAVHQRYGGWGAFAQKVLGVDEATLAKLRARLLVPLPDPATAH